MLQPAVLRHVAQDGRVDAVEEAEVVLLDVELDPQGPGVEPGRQGAHEKRGRGGEGAAAAIRRGPGIQHDFLVEDGGGLLVQPAAGEEQNQGLLVRFFSGGRR